MKFSIIKNRKIWFLFSGTLSILSTILLLTPGLGLPLSIDFTGGTQMQIDFKEFLPKNSQIEEVFHQIDTEHSPKIIRDESANSILMRTPFLSSEQQLEISTLLSDQGFTHEIMQVSSIGPTLGDHFKKQSFWAISIAIICIILFVAWAFRKVPQGISSWKFGISAILALTHDVLIIAGFFAFIGLFINIEIDTLFVTALLTVLGFSVHDTIVVFDRLRENLHGQKVKHLEEIAEKALWQTMGRSIHTSVSTILVLGALLLFGASSIFAFVLALSFGILIGTYSSIFLAVPFLVEWILRGENKPA